MMLKNNCDFIRETSNVDYPIHFKGIAITGERFLFNFTENVMIIRC
jgi:hypothetical protein